MEIKSGTDLGAGFALVIDTALLAPSSALCDWDGGTALRGGTGGHGDS